MTFKVDNIQWDGNSNFLPDKITITLKVYSENRKFIGNTPDEIGDMLFLGIIREFGNDVTIKSFIWCNKRNPGKTYRWIPMYEQIGPHTWRRNR